MASDTLVNLEGDLRTAYNQSVPGKNRHVDELTAERITNKALRDQWFYTADGELYSLQKGVPTLDITREKDNLLFRHLNDEVDCSYDQLVHNHNYRADKAEAQAAMNAPETVRIDLSLLPLEEVSDEWGYVAISTAHYDRLNPEVRKLAERVFGQGQNFVAARKMFKDAGITETRAYVLIPEYVAQHAEEGPVGRASRLGSFVNFSVFLANGRNVILNNRLRGVRRVVAP